MKMDEGLDTGDILMVEKVKLDAKETGGSLFDRLSDVGAHLLVKTLEGLEAGTITPVKQDDSESTYVKCFISHLVRWISIRVQLNLKDL